MDDTILMPELDKAIMVIKNYVEILEKKVIELGTENKDLKIENHDLHNELALNKKKLEVLSTQATDSYLQESDKKKEGFGGYYQNQPEWSGGFRKREEKADAEAEKKSLRERWTNMRIEEL